MCGPIRAWLNPLNLTVMTPTSPSALSPYRSLLDAVPVRREEVLLLGSHTCYWEYGDPNADDAIVVVHGFRGDHHGLEPVIAQLGPVRIIAPDLPGFGESEPLAGRIHDLDAYAAWLRALVESLDIRGRLTVLGHSFGSIVAAATVASGLRVDSLVLVNPIAAPALSGPRGVLTRLAVFYYWLGATLPPRLGFALLKNRVIVRATSVAMVKTKVRSLRRWIHGQHDQYFSAFASREVVLEAFRASISNDVSEFAGQITAPTLLIAAERDDITTVAKQHELADRFPDATLHVIDGVGHLVHYETPAAAAALIRSFLGIADLAPEMQGESNR